ncbi:alpha/beta hydrolase [Phenylobacterium sp.]|jgi:pimeloyl-ACP methyl ester carboxylesterase|uniref:alpha/beta hydrolase n=1 Tax=Phenylobacterium sp. TaxID=1871053 RepID=UPI002F425D58
MPAPVVMVHGAFCGGWAFEDFAPPFLAAGHAVLRPDLPGHRAEDGPDAVSGLSMADYVREIAALCARQVEPPVLIGHSLGGLVAQLVAARTPLCALALLAPSAPWGVPVSSLEEAAAAFGVQMMGPFWTGAVPPDRGVMGHYALDRLSPPAREKILARLRPESGRAMAQTLTWWFDPFMTTSLGAGPLKVPALAFAAEHDRVHAPASVRRTATRIGADYRLIPEMSHWMLGGPGSAEAADLILAWLAKL